MGVYFVVGYCCVDQEGVGFDVVGQYFVFGVVQVFDVVDYYGGGVGVFDLCVYGVQVQCQIDYFWFLCGVFDDGGVVSQGCCYYDVFGVGDGYYFY